MIDKIQVILICILIPIGAVFLYTKTQDVSIREIFFPAIRVMHIGEIPVRVEIANTPEERQQGLSGRKEIEHVNGMLFVFEEEDYHSIWMKDMEFPIDIIWISEDLKVVGIERDVSPNSYPRTYRPPKPAKYAVETNPLYAYTMGINVGNPVRLPPNYLED